MPLTITVPDSLARQFEQQAGLRDVSPEECVLDVLRQALKRQLEAAEAQPVEDDGPWSDEKNARRCDLIDKQIEGAITSGEREELASLQIQLRQYLDTVAPLDLEGARQLHQRLLQKKRDHAAKQDSDT